MKKSYITIMDIIFLFISGALILFPYFLNVNFEGHDTVFHYRCVEAVSSCSLIDIIKGLYTKDGILYGMMADHFTGKTGYGVGIFYPPLSHVTAAMIYKMLSFTGISLMACIRISQILCMSLSGIFMYILCRNVRRYPSDDEVIAINQKRKAVLNPEFAVALLYMTGLYHISDHVVRDALAECWIFVFIPILFLSLLYLVRDDYRCFLLFFVIACVGLVHSHLMMTVYVAGFFGFSLIVCFCDLFCRRFEYAEYEKEGGLNKKGKKWCFLWKRILAMLVGVIITILISLPFFVRLIENKRGADYFVFEGDLTFTDLLNRNRLSFFDFFVGMKNGNIAVHSNLIFLGLVIVALLMYYYPFKDSKNKQLKIWLKKQCEYSVLFKSGILFFILSSLLSSKLINWEIMPYFLRIIQFPFRLLVLQTFGMSLIVFVFITAFMYFISGASEDNGFNKIIYDAKKLIMIIIISCIAYTFIEQFSNYMLVYDRDFRGQLDMYPYDDYLPMNAVGRYLKEEDADTVYAVFTDKSDIDMIKQDNIKKGLEFPAIISEKERMVFETVIDNNDTIQNNENLIFAQIPRIYYQGYTIKMEMLSSDNGKKSEKLNYFETDYGFIGIIVPENSRITVEFTGTEEEINANRISLVAIILFMLYCILGFLHNRVIENKMKAKSCITE